MKQRALQLLREGWELEDVTDALGVSSKSIGRWSTNFETHGRVDPPAVLRGRPRLLNAEAIADLQELIQETPELFLSEIGEWLALYHDLSISKTALHTNLIDLGLTRKVMRRAAAERDHELRTEWMNYVLTTYTAD